MKKYITSLILATLWLTGFSGSLCAALIRPSLTVETDKKNVTAFWQSSDDPEGYILLLAPYPGAENLYSVDMGKQTSISADLWENAAFYIAVMAYDGIINSDYSNIEHFIITASDDDTTDSGDDSSTDGSVSAQIVLQGNSITVSGSGVTVNANTAIITSAGTYNISGTLTDGQIVVDTEDDDAVKLVLNGANISSSTSSPVYIISAKNTEIVLADNTVNYIIDGESYIFADAEEDEPDAAIFSKSDLTIYGNGFLSVDANYNDGIKSKDGLIIAGGTITVDSVDDGIVGKDYITVKGCNITVNAQGDGLKSTNDGDTSKGYIAIESGKINITSGSDGIQAETNITITDGDINIVSGGGSRAILSDMDASAKGIKSGVSTVIDGGLIIINAADDAINSNDNITVNGGNFAIASGDDGFHADASLTINNGDINIAESYEGIESAVITINNGNIHIISSDDGLNVAGGNDSSGNLVFPGGGEPVWPGNDQVVPGGGQVLPGGGQVRPGRDDVFINSADYYLYINGGYIVVDANGDGIDANGAIEMNGGTVIVNGPTDNNNSALDYDASFKITGGFLLAAGSSGMAQAPGTSSSQYSVMVQFNFPVNAGTLVNIQTDDGKTLFSFTPSKAYQAVVFSSPELANGSTYAVYYGGSATGISSDGLYQGGTYTPGTKYTSFTISSIVTNTRL